MPPAVTVMHGALWIHLLHRVTDGPLHLQSRRRHGPAARLQRRLEPLALPAFSLGAVSGREAKPMQAFHRGGHSLTGTWK